MKDKETMNQVEANDEMMPCQKAYYKYLTVEMALAIFQLAEQVAYKIKATTNEGSYSTDVDSFGCFFDLTQHHRGVIVLQSLGPKGNTFIQDLYEVKAYPESVEYVASP